MEVVKGLDIERYMGSWYEIASIPMRFQPKNGMNTRANFKLNDNGTVQVVNETWSDCRRVSIEGTAFKVDPKSDEAKFKLRFNRPRFFPIIPVIGDFWVLFIDPDYQYTLIGGPTRRYLWILNRETKMEEERYNEVVQKAVSEGYDVSKLRKTPQAYPPLQTHYKAIGIHG